MSRVGDTSSSSNSFIKVIILCILALVAVFYLNILGLGHDSQQPSQKEHLANKLLNQKIDSTRDYVEKLEHEIMKLAVDKKEERKTLHEHGQLHENQGHRIDRGQLLEQLKQLRSNPENPNQFLPHNLLHNSGHSSDMSGSNGVIGIDLHNPLANPHHLHNLPHHSHLHQSHESSGSDQHVSSAISSPSISEGYNLQLHPSSQTGKLPEIPPDVEKIDPDFYSWLARIKEKFYCLEITPQNIGYFHYHIRKAAGTTIRDIIKTSLSRFKKSPIAKRQMLRPSVINVDNYYETEGIVLLYPELLEINNLLSIITLREPINRILSLYWYEHVGWYDGILKQPHRCKKMETWVDAWLDGSDFKNNFVKKFPDNNYVEIENYYVKSLIGHVYAVDHQINGGDIHGNGEELTRKDLEKAKAILRKFDIIFITEWMGDDTQMDVVNTIFPGRTQISPGHKVKGDFRMKERLRPTLAANEEEIKKKLRERNQLDLELYEYAQSLISLRLKFLIPLYTAAKSHAMEKFHSNLGQSVPVSQLRSLTTSDHQFDLSSFQCSVTPKDVQHRKTLLAGKYKKVMGVMQPPGHKGP